MNKQKILIVGISGNMGMLTAERVMRTQGLELMPFGIIGPNDDAQSFRMKDKNIQCLRFDEVDEEKIRTEKPIIIDFTHKEAILPNWKKYYKDWKCPLIIGTIGIKKADLIGNRAPVIIGSPNLAPEIVQILKGFSNIPLFSNCANLFLGCFFEIIESHQAIKTEVSGTANQMEEYILEAGGIRSKEITSIRDPKKQKEMGISEEYLKGHGWHSYIFQCGEEETLRRVNNYLETILLCIMRSKGNWYWQENNEGKVVSNRENTSQVRVNFKNDKITFSHNINGRMPYIDGLFETVIPFLKAELDRKEKLVSGLLKGFRLPLTKSSIYDMFDIS